MIIIKNIVFDLGGVILKDKPNSVLEKLEIDNNIYYELNRFFDNWEKLDLGEETLEEKFKQCNFSKNIKDKYKDFLLNYYKYRDIDIRLIDCINRLKSNGYNIYILSDNNKECFEHYKNQSDFKNIDGWILSCDYHTSKKDGKLFDILIDSFGLNPNECYYIDNNINNIEEANKHGINGYLFNAKEDINKLYNDMRNNNINI